MRTLLLIPACLLLLLLSACRCAQARAAMAEGSAVLVNVDRDGLALQGYDAVAYFTQQRPVLGTSAHQTRYMGAYYRFSSAENLAAFEADPARYAPAYGGYCGYAASIDRLSPIDPEFFQILDGRLVLQHNQRAWDKWNADLQANLVKADANWPGLVERNGTSERRLVNVDDAGLALEGHDPVAYFEQGQPVKGDPQHEAVFDGARYHFASARTREVFEREPARYVPAFGGYCGYAASIDRISPVDPTIFQILDGRLVLQHTPKAYRLFNKAPEENLAKADANWPGLVACKGR
jgi:YHS domain-containing protein